MTVEINMRLDVGGSSYSESEFELLARSAVAVLGQFGTVEHRVRVLGMDQPRYLVARVQVADIPEPALFTLAVQFGQECLGIYYPGRNVGCLLGPLADRWGPFKLDEFERFERVHEPVTEHLWGPAHTAVFNSDNKTGVPQ